MLRRQLLGFLPLLPALAASRSVLADQPVRIVMPFAPGGTLDTIARLLAEHLRAEIGRAVVVENRAGAAGRIGVQAVKAAAADGGTLLITPIAPMAVYSHVYRSLAYDPLTDFQPVTQIGTFDFALATAPNLGVSSASELVAWLKRNPGRANYGTPGAGTIPHLIGVLLGRAAGIELQHIAYKGTTEALPDLLAGQVALAITSTDGLNQLHKTGRVRVVATSGRERSHFLPEVATLREAGYDFDATGWHGIFAPARTPPAVIDGLSQALARIIAKPEVAERFRALGLMSTGIGPAAFAEIQRADTRFWAAAVQASGFTAED
jgi:tripartite-type tricarboxylate transporter receptor subunit TctC